MKFYLFLILNTFALSQSLVINEIVSSNSSIFYDEDGDTPDWVEIYNANTNAVNLGGYGLSDDISEKFKWKFPDIIIEPNEYLLVLASDKDKNNIGHLKVHTSEESNEGQDICNVEMGRRKCCLLYTSPSPRD